MDIPLATATTSTSTNPNTTMDRPLSPVERILQGQLDGRPLFAVPGRMDALLIALAKVLKLLTKDKLSNNEKRKAFLAMDQISTEDIRKAVEHASLRTIEEMTSFEDITQHKVKAPEIDQAAQDYVSPQASKDFSTRINNGYFASVAKHTCKMKDILQAVADVTTFYKLSPKAALGLLRRCLRDPARQLMENLVSSNASLDSLFASLQDHYNTTLSCTEASQKLRTLLNTPISNLDDFLSDLLNLSIASVKDLPHSEANKSGFLLATGYLTQYIHKHYPSLSSILTHDFKTIQAAQRNNDPSASYLGMMRVLRVHRDAIESAARRGPKHGINAIEFGIDPNSLIDHATAAPPDIPSKVDIQDMIRNEIRQNFTQEQQPASHQDQGQIKAMLQEVFHEFMGNNQANSFYPNPMYTPPQQEVPGFVQEVNPGWNRDRPQAPQPNRVPNGQAQPNQQPSMMQRFIQRGGQMLAGRPPFGQGPQGMRPNGPPNVNGGNPNRMPVGNNAGNNMGPRRNFIPEEVYNKHFSQNNCFLCALPGHSYRQCPVFGPNCNVAHTPCPDCESHGIYAFHPNCHGRNHKAHQNMARPRDNQNQWNNGQNQVNQIDTAAFYPEEGISLLPQEPCVIQQNFPLYVPTASELPKN